ncbi:signal peptidase I [Ruminococcaceae bacterium OttesenSCG-928-A16]|nr:signal peptidase I [Ruminococcaceae bacterium OttesenSCG-928-A16]
MRKIGKIFSNILVVVLVIAVGVLAVPRLFGVKMFSVLSGSMVPTYQVGDLLYAVPTPQADIQVGDAISFVINENLTVVTHRVVEIDAQNGYFYTQGDANNIRDGAPVSYKNVVGVVKFSIPKIGYLFMALNIPFWRNIMLAALAVLLLATIVASAIKPKPKPKKTTQPYRAKTAGGETLAREEKNETLHKRYN